MEHFIKALATGGPCTVVSWGEGGGRATELLQASGDGKHGCSCAAAALLSFIEATCACHALH